jgi:hypothetical protein
VNGDKWELKAKRGLEVQISGRTLARPAYMRPKVPSAAPKGEKSMINNVKSIHLTPRPRVKSTKKRCHKMEYSGQGPILQSLE